MDNEVKKEMISYYNERAEEYDDLYIGKSHFTLDPCIYLKDVTKVSEMTSGFGNGHLIDIACGTGFWMFNYARNCSRITLLDQSEKMLKECKKRVEKLGLINSTEFIQGDFLEVTLEPSTFDSALVGFLLSHLTIEQEKFFFLKLKKILKSNGQLMIIDGAWNNERQKYTKKEGIQERVLNDGRRFKIYKRYFEKSDLEGMAHRYNFKIKSCYVGTAFIAVILERV
ncbi:MAG: class I SAM-dependent methyltransferase [Methanomicrobia archaeon]|nr:class I SAM-dependent methyltransferase [Methanomicrobia archaeon]